MLREAASCLAIAFFQSVSLGGFSFSSFERHGGHLIWNCFLLRVIAMEVYCRCGHFSYD